MLTKIVSQSIDIDKDIQTSIHNDCVYLLKKNLEFSVPANLICALFVFLILFNKTQSLWLFSWFLSIILISLLRCFTSSNFANWSIQRSLNYLIIATVLSGILWGILGSFLMPYRFLDQRVVIIIIICISTVEMDTLKSNANLGFAFLLLSLLPLILWFFYQATLIYYLLGIAFLTYAFFILFAFFRGHNLMINNLILHYQNLNLFKKLFLNNEIIEASETRFHSAFDFAAIGMALVSLDGHFLKVNKSLCQLVGYDEKALLSLNFQAITYSADLERDLQMIQQLLNGEIITYQLEKRYLHKDKRIIWSLLSVSLLRDKQNNPLYFIAQIQNIDAQKKAEEELRMLAYHDNLTGLANRKQLEAFFDFALANAKRHNTQLAILFIDLDFFKLINDQYGHAVGDLLLKEIGQRLKSSLRASDLPVRLGGDEFIVILTNIGGREYVTQVAKKLLLEITKPMYLQNHEISITASIGICLYPQNEENLIALLLQADKALYEVKSAGKNNFKFS